MYANIVYLFLEFFQFLDDEMDEIEKAFREFDQSAESGVERTDFIDYVLVNDSASEGNTY